MAAVEKYFFVRYWPVVLLVPLMGSLLLIADATRNETGFERLHHWLLPFNLFLLSVFLVLIVFNVVRLVLQVVRQKPGSRLTLRMLVMFVLLAILPVGIVYSFSIWLLQEGVDSWFDVDVEQVLQDSVDLSRSSLDLHMRKLLQETEPMIAELAGTTAEDAPLVINDLMRRSDMAEIVLFDQNSQIIASGGEMGATMMPQLPGETVMRMVSQGETYVGLDPMRESGMHVHLVFPVPTDPLGSGPRMVQVMYPISGHISNLALNVQEGFSKYNQLRFLRTPLKRNFNLILTLVLLLGVLFAVWAAFYSARRLAAPIRDLAQGTQAVAAGQYHKKLPVEEQDDLGMLVASFNQMTEQLALAHDEAKSSQRLIDSQRLYLQTILENLSSGVISLDPDRVIRTVNPTASLILGEDLNRFVGRNLSQLPEGDENARRFFEQIEPLMQSSAGHWQTDIKLADEGETLMCRGVMLPGEAGQAGGHVLVFEDVTELIRAQRDSAWGEVARRLAHEIKNPLTPIQLSAERLSSKILPGLGKDQAGIVDRATRTIVQQVESMKEMVNAFADYARAVQVEAVPLDLNGLVTEVIELYRDNTDQIEITARLDASAPRIRGDSTRMRQVLHNLLKNALEAMHEQRRQGACIEVITQCFEVRGVAFVSLVVVDDGPGIPYRLLERLFEPYVTTKVKGNGLGLAIVKKIVEEHGGTIRAENAPARGARIRIRLPVIDAREAGLSGEART